MFRRLFPFILFFPFLLNAQTAFISGNDTICDNASKAIVTVDFTGAAPFTFSYLINGVNQSSITTQNTSYSILTSIPGTYTLQSFNDVTMSAGTISGSAIVTVLESPTAIIHLASDTLSVIYPIANFVSQSIGNIVSWNWNCGDNGLNINTEDALCTYSTSGIYQAVLIIKDINGCFDTAIYNVWVNEEYRMYIPTSFTPDNKDPNNKFCIEYSGIRENTFLFKVLNSQGDLMYQSVTPSELRCCINPPNCSVKGGWDGTYYKTSKKIPSDTYVYKIYFQDFEGWKHREYGSIMLIR